MKKMIDNAVCKAVFGISRFRTEERGEVNLISILLIIIVTIGLVMIFKEQIGNLISSIFVKITNDVGNM